MNKDDMPISKEQIKKIHTLKHEMGMSDRTYRQRLARVGVKSCKELTFKQAKGFIYWFDIAAAKRSGRTPQRRSYGSLRITEKQMEMIHNMWREAATLEPGEDFESALNHLIENKYHISALHWMPRRLVHKLVETIKAMKAQKLGKETAQAAEEAIKAGLPVSAAATT